MCIERALQLFINGHLGKLVKLTAWATLSLHFPNDVLPSFTHDFVEDVCVFSISVWRVVF
jgi:hypothetical protein